MRDPKTEVLLEKFVTGDKGAFHKLYKRYTKAIMGFISARCYGALKSRVNDIHQETWAVIWEKHAQYNGEHSFYSFVRFWAEIMIKRAFSGKEAPLSLEDMTGEPEIPIQPEPTEESLEMLEGLLKFIFTSAGPPHQVYAFGFNKLLSGWKPGKIVRELSDILFQKLHSIFIEDYRIRSCLPELYLKELFVPLSERLFFKTGDVLDDLTSRENYKNLLDTIVGQTAFRDFYSRNPEHNITDWSYKVKQRILKNFK